MDKVQDVINVAKQQCKAHGVKLTQKRIQILSGLLLSKKAVSAYELIDFCEERFGEPIPAITAYRVLEVLENENLVHKLNTTNKYVACSHIGEKHDHDSPQFLICGKCQKVKELNMSTLHIEEIKKSIDRAGFQIACTQLEFDCICKECLSEKNSQQIK